LPVFINGNELTLMIAQRGNRVSYICPQLSD